MVSFSVDPVLHLAAPPAAAPPPKHGPIPGPSFSDHLDQAEQTPRQAPAAKRSDEPDNPQPSEPAGTSPADTEAEQNAADGTEQAEGSGEPHSDGAAADEESTPQEEPRDELELSATAVSGSEPPFEIAVDPSVQSAEAGPADQASAQAEASASTKPAEQLDSPAAEKGPEADASSKRPIAADAPDDVAAADQATAQKDAERLKDDAQNGAANGGKTATKTQPQPQPDVPQPDVPQPDVSQSEKPQQTRYAPRPERGRKRDAGPHPHAIDVPRPADAPFREEAPRRDVTRLRVEGPRVETAEPGRGTEPAASAESSANSETRLRITAGRLAGTPGSSEGAKTRSVDQVRFVQRVARAFHAARNGPGEIRLRLHPPELGQLRLEVRMEDGTLQARMETETATAKSVLLDHLPALRERLAQQDIRLDRVNVDVMQHSDGGPDQRAAEDARPDRQQMAPGRGSRDDEAADVVTENTGFIDTDNGNLNIVI